MDREEVIKRTLESNKDNLALILSTGFGKTRTSLLKMKQWLDGSSFKNTLIIVPKIVLIQNWKDEIKKWNMEKYLEYITFTTYNSLSKYENNRYEVVIIDEAHHTTERCQEILTKMTVRHILFLSATVSNDNIQYFKERCHYNIDIIKVSIKEAVDNNVLPDPKIILIPMALDTVIPNQIYIKSKPKNGNYILIDYKDRFSYAKYKKAGVRIKCTQYQYYEMLNNLISYYKRLSYNKRMKDLWLYKSKERIVWLANQKTELVNKILNTLKNSRVLVFSASIEQSHNLTCSCVNSKDGMENLDLFNERKINHLSAVDTLTEGANLVDCKVSVFQVINSSLRLQVQKIGRSVRHSSPIIIYPYFVATREEEILNKVIETFNKQNIYTCYNFNDFKELYDKIK